MIRLRTWQLIITSRRIVIGLMVLGLAIALFPLPATENVALPLIDVTQVQASCTVMLNADTYQQRDDMRTETLTLVLLLPDGTPLPGICLTFTRDMGVGETPQVLGNCITDQDGRCSIEAPDSIITVHFGNTTIGGLKVNNGQPLIDYGVSDATGGSLAYHFPATQPSENLVVANPADDGTLDLLHARRDADGNIVPLQGGPEISDEPVIPEPIAPPPVPPGIPEGNVQVAFQPTIIHTADSYERLYCHYITADQAVRVPPAPGTFLPGSGQYFDVQAVLSGEFGPTQVLNAPDDMFEFSLECWGWQGDTLVQLGSITLEVDSEMWQGQVLTTEGEGFSLEYALAWEPLSEDSLNPTLPNENNRRLDANLAAPDNVRLETTQIAWDYPADPDTPIGGFRIYRNGYLIGSTPPDGRAWAGDGLAVLECGIENTFHVTAFAGRHESAPSLAGSLPGETCAAHARIDISTVSISNLQDCDGDACGPLAEAYGFMTVNTETRALGRGRSRDTQFLSLRDGTYPLAALGTNGTFDVNIGMGESVFVALTLFDHDDESGDDILCSWSGALGVEEVQAWLSAGGTTLTREASGEATCVISLQVSPGRSS